MPERRRSRTVLAILTLIALVLITFDYRQGEDEGMSGALRRGALVVFAPVQDGFAQVARPIGGFFSGIGELASIRRENAELVEEVAELESQMPSVDDLERENAELRALLRMRDELELETTGARVIGQTPGGHSNTVVIDAGQEDGIEEGMAVLSARGLVGKVTTSTPRYAWVELMTSPSARYAIRIAETGERGLLRGQGGDPFQLELLEFESRVAANAEVVTHTFQGSTIPDGLPVGEVVEEDADAPSPRYHQVRPFVDFRRLSFVQVVLNAPEPPIEPPQDEEDEEDEEGEEGDEEGDEEDEGDENEEGEEGDQDPDDDQDADDEGEDTAARRE